ncbi:MAG: biotin/lipoate A/B protein ligase family protein [Thermoanaerobaculum sp.]
MGEGWVVLGDPSEEIARHLAWDLLTLPAPQVRALPVREVAVVLPRSRDPHREVYLQNCERDHVPVVRRPSGGGAVVLAPGVVTVSALAPLTGPRNTSQLFTRFCGLVSHALQRLEVPPLQLRGVSDLCLGDRKVVGSSLRLLLKTVLFQASVLVDADLSLLDRYLPFPSRAPDYREGRPHRDFVTTLAKAGFPRQPEVVAAALEHEFRQALASDGGSG